MNQVLTPATSLTDLKPQMINHHKQNTIIIAKAIEDRKSEYYPTLFLLIPGKRKPLIAIFKPDDKILQN